MGSCVKRHCDVGLSISLLATQPWLFEINMICLVTQPLYISLENTVILTRQIVTFN